MAEKTKAERGSEEIGRRNVETMRRVERAALEEATPGERAVHAVARFCGTPWFAVAHAVWIAAWVALNAIAGLPRFDPYPFPLLGLCVSVEAVMLASMILMGENRARKAERRRAELDMQVSLIAEQEATKTLRLLEAVALKVGALSAPDPEVEALAGASGIAALEREAREARESCGESDE